MDVEKSTAITNIAEISKFLQYVKTSCTNKYALEVLCENVTEVKECGDWNNQFAGFEFNAREFGQLMKTRGPLANVQNKFCNSINMLKAKPLYYRHPSVENEGTS